MADEPEPRAVDEGKWTQPASAVVDANPRSTIADDGSSIAWTGPAVKPVVP
jgi:hypothetical protein